MMPPAEFGCLEAAEQRFWWCRGMRRITAAIIAAYAHGKANWRVLDAGCGAGHFARWLEQERGWTAFPIDRMAEGVRLARGKGLRRTVQADLTALPFESNSFDAAFCLDVLVYAAPGQEHAMLSELHRVLSPGGLLILRAAACNLLRSRDSQFVGERQRFGRGRLVRSVSEAGFRVLRCTYANSLLLPIALLKFRLWEPLLRRRPASGLQPLPEWLNRLLFLCLAAESRWLKAGRNLPLGQSLILVALKPPAC